jgi:orotidine-5'-phosphate decarboxylase
VAADEQAAAGHREGEPYTGDALGALGGHRRGIVCACDVDDLAAAARLVEAIDSVDGLIGYKLGSLLTLRHGLAHVIEVFHKVTTKMLIYDHQKAGLDIPSMAAEYVSACRDTGLDALILFPLAGPTALDAFVGRTLEAGLIPIVGGALPLPDYLAKGGGYVAGSALGRITERALALGARNFIVPATDLAAIRAQARRVRAAGGGRLFLPGIGPLGGELGRAFGAAPGCMTYAIIGRGIYAASDPAAAAQRLAADALTFETAR